MKSVKMKSMKKQFADKNIVSMFNQMLGTEDSDPSITIPKYTLMRGKIRTLSRLLSAATEDVFIKSLPEERDGCDDILKYVESLNSIQFVEVPPTDLLTMEIAKEISNNYSALKNNNDVKIIIMTCKNLIGYSNNLSIGESFDDSFIARIPGFDFSPFPFSRLNIKRIWASPQITDKIKKYIFTVMKIVLDISKEVYKTLTSPDVDVKEFSKAIINSIAQVKKQIPRCEKAFARIEESVGLLEGNFDGYYKDFIQSQNPSTIIESFVIDVSQAGGADPQTTRQFRKIIEYYRKATQGKITDPKVKQLFDMLGDNFNAMEKEHGEQHVDDEPVDTVDENSTLVETVDAPVDSVIPSKNAKRRHKKRLANAKNQALVDIEEEVPPE